VSDVAHNDSAADQPDSSELQPGLQERFRNAAAGVKLALPGQVPPPPAALLHKLVEETAGLDDPTQWDRYGAKGPVLELESRVAELFGKPAAAMFPSGIMAQQATLRVWADRQGRGQGCDPCPVASAQAREGRAPAAARLPLGVAHRRRGGAHSR
jgi:hypothetical protein